MPAFPKWISADDVQAVHKAAIIKHGGSHGIRDKSLLLSAIESPRNRLNKTTDGENISVILPPNRANA